jgi:putative ABC transport system permease protein
MKYQLITQFMAESFLFCLISMALSYVVFYFGLPFLNQLTGKQLVFTEVIDLPMVMISAALLLVIAGMAGGYPAFFVAQFNSVGALKGAGITEHGSRFLRKALVVFQLTIASMLLCGSLLIIRQLNYLSDRPLGFQREHIINIPLFSQNLNGVFRQNDTTFRQRLQTYRDVVEMQSGIVKTALSSNAPGLGVIYNGAVPEGFTQEDNLFIASLSVDFDFLDTYGMELVAGRSFSRDFGNDTESFIVNETAVQEFEWGTPAEALGKTMNHNGREGKVVGVIEDFNFSSLTTPISAIILHVSPNGFSTLSVRFENQNVQSTIELLEAEWNRMFPEKGFQYTFLDQQLNNQYQNYINFGAIIQAFTFIAILIACLGVYGLVLFVVQRKVKEIGVRKVLGATIGNILTLIYKDFAWLMTIGFALAIPVSYYLLNQWLENFTYRTSISATTYLVSFGLVLLVVTITVSYQAIRASLTNPVNSLRRE